MAIVREKDMRKNIDSPKRSIDIQQRLLDEALKDKYDVKSTPLSRLTSIRTEITYYEQIISNRQGNLSNTANLAQFDPKTQKYRKISNVIVLTDELDSQLDKDVFTDITYEGTAKFLPNTLIPNRNDYFIMRVFESYHVFRVIEVNPTLIEKDSGYEIRFDMYRQDVDPVNFELNEMVKESYTFDYNHIGTEFRTIIKDDEYNFIQKSRNMMYSMTNNYLKVFYHKLLNTIMCQTGYMNYSQNHLANEIVKNDPTNMIGAVLLEGRSIYDISLVKFINKFDLFNTNDYVSYITEYIKTTPKYYNSSIFSAIENIDITRFRNKNHLIIYSNTNLYHHPNTLYGRFLLEHVKDYDNDCFVLNLFPSNLIQKIENYNGDLLLNATPDYDEDYADMSQLVNDVLSDIISCFINETDIDKKRMIILKLVNIFTERFSNYTYADEFENPVDIFYTYPLAIYVLKYMTREILFKEYT